MHTCYHARVQCVKWAEGARVQNHEGVLLKAGLPSVGPARRKRLLGLAFDRLEATIDAFGPEAYNRPTPPKNAESPGDEPRLTYLERSTWMHRSLALGPYHRPRHRRKLRRCGCCVSQGL